MIIWIVADDGVVGTSTDVIFGVADAVFDGSVKPVPIFATTTNEYVLSVFRLDTM